MKRATGRDPGAGIRVTAVVAGALASVGCDGNQSMFNPQGPVASSSADLGWFLIALSAVIYIAVMSALAIALWRRRRDDDRLPQTTRRLARNVTLASAGTVVTLVALAVATFASDRGLNSPSGPGALNVDVIGHQWWWDFQYRDVSPQDVVSSPNELHVPVGVPVVVRGASRDVIHSFWVPNLRPKRDLTPGFVTHTWFQADAPGTYRGQCAEFCGHQHARMAFHVVAEPMPKFLEWIAHQRRPANEPESGAQRHGRDVFMQAPCVTCHTIRGTEAGSLVGPDLTHVGSRLMLGAGTLPNTRDHLRQWVTNSQAVKPGNRMPPVSLDAANLDALLSYLRSLR
jgi:cytochrome c oxidase subunit 2